MRQPTKPTAALLTVLGLAVIVFASPAKGQAATKPAIDRIPHGWDVQQIGRDAFIGRDKEVMQGKTAKECKAKLLLWKISENSQPLRIEECILWIEFVALDGKPTQRLINLCRHDNGDSWALSRVLDAPHRDYQDFDHAPTNKEVYTFLDATWWHFSPTFIEQGFVTLDASVCSVAWKEVTAEEPTKFFSRTQPVLWGRGELECGPQGRGNIYAPDILVENNIYRMWYGAQGKDGHDRILYAESTDGLRWQRKGLAVEDATANHVNDPSVVKVYDTYFMYFTRAAAGVVDEIALATSSDGMKWMMRGTVMSHGAEGAWDSLSVGRPSVLHEDGVYKLWYDGRKDLPPNAPSEKVPKSATSARSVGYATSADGLHWTKHVANPVFGHDSGGVDVKRIGKQYVMACESHRGTRMASSSDGLKWVDHGLWIAKTGTDFDNFGQVTPCLLVQSDQDVRLYFGGAAAAAWDENAIAVHPVSSEELASATKAIAK